MQKIAGVVTVYYPVLDDFFQNINSYIDFLDVLFIWDNTPASESQSLAIRNQFSNEKVHVISNGKNEGLAIPFNTCIHKAGELGCNWLLTMDQDSFFETNQFTTFLQLVFENQLKDIGIYAPQRTGFQTNNKIFTEQKTVISSGSLYPLNIFKLGGFREDFFMYMLDIDFCLRIRNQGFRIVTVGNVVLQHHEGHAYKKWGVTLNNYSATSTYYIIRNNIITWKLYPTAYNIFEKIHFIWYKIIFRILKLLLEKDRIRKFHAIFLACWHGSLCKTGQLKNSF